MQKFYKTLTIALACVIMAGFASCNDPDLAREYNASPRELEFSATGGTQTVYVSGDKWEATSNDEWIDIEMGEGKIIVSVGANETTEAKSGSITVEITVDSETTDTKTINVKQRAHGAPALTVEKERVVIFDAGGIEMVKVTSELEWTATTEDEWISIAKAGNSFRINIAAYENTGSRTGSVIVDNGENSKTIVISQIELVEVVFASGDIEFIADDDQKNISNFALDFADAAGDNAVYLDVITALIEAESGEAKEFPAGTYTYNATNDRGRTTFMTGTQAQTKYTDKEDVVHTASIVDGKFIVAKQEAIYTIEFELEFNDALMRGSYIGSLALPIEP